jgi:hypothetical protein
MIAAAHLLQLYKLAALKQVSKQEKQSHPLRPDPEDIVGQEKVDFPGYRVYGA